jgi:Ala-tRNA(Pro) deacylase
MEDCRQQRGEHIQGVFCKNLFVRDKKKQYFLISALEDADIDLNRLRKELGASRCLTFSTEDEMKEKLRVLPGGVSPLAAFNFQGVRDITVVLDQKMMEADLANFHPLDLASTLTISPADLLLFLSSCGIAPVIHDFNAPAKE